MLKMNIGIIGLGLIGGSMAKALKKYTAHCVYGEDIQQQVCQQALRDGAIDTVLTPELYRQCQVIIVALYPQLAIDAISSHAADIAPGTLVVDCCGVKEPLWESLAPLAKEHCFTFIGGHPMAGVENFGYSAASADLFAGASMILTPAPDEEQQRVSQAEQLFLSIGFKRICRCTPQEHDRMIAYTSQLAHIVSSAYVQSPAAMKHLGFSAGSFQDMTRVAKLNEQMWVELFLDNKQNLLDELDSLITRLQQFSAAITTENRDSLFALLHEGRITREAINNKEHLTEEKQ